MSAQNEIKKIIKSQGWTDSTVRILAEDFLDENLLTPRFLEYLEKVVADEETQLQEGQQECR